MIVLDVALLALLIGTVLPILVGIVTTKVESRKVKSILLITLSAVSGLLTGALQGGGAVTKEALYAGFVSYITAIAVHYGVYKPSGVTEVVQTKIGRTD